MNKIKFSLFVLLISALVLVSCENETDKQQDILGKWISSNKNDTLDFVDSNNFYKNGIHFGYNLYGDSIEVEYEGDLKILPYPTKHRYSLENNVIVIDFSNKICYGFEMQKVTYNKK